MIIDRHILDALTARARVSPRLRMNLDLRNSTEDQSQRMLNAIEPGTRMPVHRHRTTSETVVCLRGHFEEYFYDEFGVLTDVVDMRPGGRFSTSPPGVGIAYDPWRAEPSSSSAKMGHGRRWSRRMS